jgi:transcriptional regulator with XRE-family HTH domain
VRQTPVDQLGFAVGPLVGERVAKLRKARGWTRPELATFAGITGHQQRIYEIERAKRKHGLRMGTLYALALALGVEPCDLLPKARDVRDLAFPEPPQLEKS